MLSAFFAPALIGGCKERAAAPRGSTVVRVQPAESARVADNVTLTGAVQARVQGDLSFRFAGRIAERLSEVGDHVEKGQVLARLETSQQDADVASARAALVASEATLKQTTATFERQQALIDGGYTTRSLYDNANQAMLAARADLASKNSALGVALDVLDNTELKADADGIITARNGEAGQVVDVAQTVYTLAQDGPRDAVFDVFEALVVRPPADTTVRIALLSDPAVTTTGKVREIAPAVNPSSGTVRVKIRLDETPPAMGLGTAVSGSGNFRPREVISLPASAFFSRGEQAVVWVVDDRTKIATERPVEVDSFRTGELLVGAGLKPGDLVVVGGSQFLRSGQVVAPVPDGARPERAR